MLDRLTAQPPANIEAEQALLGALMIENGLIDTVAGIVTPEDFSEGIHARIFAKALELNADRNPVTPLSLKPFMAELEIHPGLPAWQYLGRLVAGAPTLNAVAYAEVVRDHAARRRLFDLGETLMATCANPDLKVSQVASEAVTALDHVLSITRSTSRKAVSIGEAMSDVMDRVLNDAGADQITTGLGSLDRVLTGGWRRKQYVILAGRPSMGKTTVATSAMLRTAKAGHGVLMLSLEMPTAQIAARAMTDLAYGSTRKVAYADLIASRLNDLDLDAIGKAGGMFATLPLVIDDQRGLTVAEIGSRIRAQAQKFERDGIKLGLVVIDHMGYVRSSDRYRGNRVHEVTEISAGLGQLAKELDIALVVLCQLNRGTEARENKRPTMADLRDSGSLEQDADVIIFTYRESYYLERLRCDPGSQQEIQRQAELDACRNTLELIVAKQRNGEATTVTCFCDMASNAIRDLAR